MSLLTTKEIAKKLGVTTGTIYRMVHAGIIPAVRIGTGRGLRFDFEDVKTALNKQSSLSLLPRQKATEDQLLALHKLGIETGIRDLAQNHDHYLYGLPLKPVVRPSKR